MRFCDSDLMTAMLVLIYLMLCGVLLQLMRWEFARRRAERKK